MTVVVEGREFRTTLEHPFYVRNRCWTEAGEFRPGHELSTSDGRWLPVSSTHRDGTQSVVYNMTVADWHTYFVGSNDWTFNLWVHNNHKGGGGSGPKKAIYNGIKDAPEYPQGFKPRTGNHTTRNNVNNKELLDELRQIERGSWKKVYKDGYDADGTRISIHFFQSESGKVFNVKVKQGWSN